MASDTPDTAALRRGCTRLATSASLELLPGATAQVPELARLLPAGARIFVPHLPGRPIGDAVPTLVALRQAGFEPVAHVAARQEMRNLMLALGLDGSALDAPLDAAA